MEKVVRKRHLIIKVRMLCSAVLFLVVSLSSCANKTALLSQNPSGNHLVPIRVAQYGEILIYLPLYIAKDKGFFEKQGLDVSITSTGGDDKTFAAVISNSAQFGIADPTFVAIAKSKGQGGAVIAAIVNGIPEWGLARGDSKVPEINNPKQLQGYSVATFPSPSTSYTLQKAVFEKAGLTPNIKQAAFGTLLAQLQSGKADIALELEPDVSIALEQGDKIVYSMGKMVGDFAFTGATTSEDMIQNHPDQVQKFVTALEEADHFAHSHIEEAIGIARKRFPDLSQIAAEQAVKRMIAGKNLPETTVTSGKAWDKACQLRIDSGDLKVSLQEARQSLNNLFAEKAANEIAHRSSP